MQTRRMGIFGASGTGKTTLAQSLITPKLATRLIVFDPMGEYKDPSIKKMATINDLVKHVRNNFGSFRVSYVPPATARADALNKLSAVALKIQAPYQDKPEGKLLTFLVDELHLGLPLHGESKCPHFGELNTHGRHFHIDIIGVSQRIAKCGMDFRSQLTQSVIFALGAPQDVAAASALGYQAKTIESLVNFQWISKKDGVISHGKTKK